ncbi:hypothetical protein ASPZODRAFT_165273 [Penicilliopsis zonata CBS 506.65]|uniref:Helicase ATP-binding domain-containing protein n=1 Tax=Penicilliopsis zonata CBS 506.65 TaxID=1073090 RepID=A0A1L9SM89_9EURO|nr:hypothetical protein ASPZODRAFT_165273 [Penicilliopsis zonata CBS 506.65]OJJ48392.1 hypothetical protein ASPZODRAFT_165273 [Penicilliopsis zonata CBS 506.65]
MARLEQLDELDRPDLSEDPGSLPGAPVALANRDIRDYFAAAESASLAGDESWLLKPEIPSPEEIMDTDDQDNDCVELLPNKIVGPWPSKQFYLKAHYDLLREDAVAPLRDAIAYVQADPGMMDSQTVSIYEKVHIVGMTFAQRGLAVRVQFSAQRAGKNIVWEYSKRLISGSIVALSPAEDCFQKTCLVAVVAARPLEGIKQQPPEIDIFFSRPQDIHFDPQQEWIMVEARTGYFEASRYTMAALQKMTVESFPLSEHICELNSEIGAPEYVKESPVITIPSVLGGMEDAAKVDLLENPQIPADQLDPSQLRALEQMLTKKLAIVQGPPGTGKTHVSVEALKIILANMKRDDPPVIISAQTNHALDQLLTHVSRFEKNYVRLGGRSTDVEIKKRTLYNVRQKQSVPIIKGGLLGPCRKKLKTIALGIAELLQIFNPENSRSILPSSFFMEHGILSQVQYKSLETGSKGWVQSTDKDDSDPLEIWLGDAVTRFEVKYSRDHFGFSEDEIDLEYEQLKELEAEQGVEGDDYETLRGQYIGLKEGFIGYSTSQRGDRNTARYLSCNDMWQIPPKSRGTVYNILCRRAKEQVQREFRRLAKLYEEACQQTLIGRWERDYLVLQDTKVIGVTATGLSKYRALISSVKPRIVMIEEAAEAIEAPIAVFCLDTLQHLILVGDHKQLKGHCSVQELEGDPFFLDVSMFERLIHNGIRYATLNRQRRMAPEIRRLLAPIYGELQDHPSVKERPAIPGMGNVASFFFSHDWVEESDSLMSKFNEKEAQMVTEFFVYLVYNGVAVKDITILTFYNGQRKRLLRLLKNHPYLQGQYVKVVTVDSYQGEENEVVLLSLVRGSDTGRSIGFLSVENRVCVAISRAKRGFYMFGNAKAIAAADPLWWEIINIMGNGNNPNDRRLGFNLPLTCTKHGRKTFVKDPSKFNFLNGGCETPCNERLACGHQCALRCHSFSHDQVSCNQECKEDLPCGHSCTQTCSDGHTCACKCDAFARFLLVSKFDDEVGTELSYVASQAHQVQTGSSAFAALSNVENERQARLQEYRDFANGGVKEHDAMLRARAESANLEYLQKQIDTMALKDLFGEKQGIPRTSEQLIPDGKGGYRKQFVEIYQAEHPSASKVKEGNLLDLD